ncbi:hypothetical protein [Colwellia ponticola]|uniref:Uncharacterized protein n=1 Tax=Colwellia ponticola TaxID=2304625 RepID=A0A8H2PML0_9GAMM|nr:hypothetical protein [Colwellia ponticola]TMM46341.1 hypothetical protein FCS21_05090 [Colwellia ponticola]
MKSLLKSIQYDMLDFIEINNESEQALTYSSEDVRSCITSLLAFMAAIESEPQTDVSAKDHVDILLSALSDLNERCGGQLIDESQSEDIIEFIEKTLISANITFTSDIAKDSLLSNGE